MRSLFAILQVSPRSSPSPPPVPSLSPHRPSSLLLLQTPAPPSTSFRTPPLPLQSFRRPLGQLQFHWYLYRLQQAPLEWRVVEGDSSWRPSWFREQIWQCCACCAWYERPFPWCPWKEWIPLLSSNVGLLFGNLGPHVRDDDYIFETFVAAKLFEDVKIRLGAAWNSGIGNPVHVYNAMETFILPISFTRSQDYSNKWRMDQLLTVSPARIQWCVIFQFQVCSSHQIQGCRRVALAARPVRRMEPHQPYRCKIQKRPCPTLSFVSESQARLMNHIERNPYQNRSTKLRKISTVVFPLPVRPITLKTKKDNVSMTKAQTMECSRNPEFIVVSHWDLWWRNAIQVRRLFNQLERLVIWHILVLTYLRLYTCGVPFPQI